MPLIVFAKKQHDGNGIDSKSLQKAVPLACLIALSGRVVYFDMAYGFECHLSALRSLFAAHRPQYFF